MALGGPSVRQARNTMGFELNAHIQVAPAIAFEPTADYYLNPDTSLYRGSAAPRHDGWQLTGLLIVSLGRLLSTSNLPF